MKLNRVTVRRMPGIADPFTLAGLGGGLVLVVGPNGSGKSSLCRAVRALLWPDIENPDPISVEAEWTDGNDTLRAAREYDRPVVWRRNGMRHDAPALPESRLAWCYSLGVQDLLTQGSGTDAGIAREILRQMSGGYEIGPLFERLYKERPQLGRQEEIKVREAARALTDARRTHAELFQREAELGALDEEFEAAREAASVTESLRTAKQIAGTRRRLEEIEKELQAFPAEMSRLLGTERERLEQLDTDLERLRKERAESAEALREAERGIEASGLTGEPIDDATLNASSARARELGELEREIRAAESALAGAEGRLEGARKQLDPLADPERIVHLDPEALAVGEEFLQRAARLRERRTQLEARRESVGDPVDEGGIRKLERAAEALRGWLAVAGSARRGRAAGLVLAGLAAAAGVAVGVLVHAWGWLLATAGAGLLAGLLVQAALARGARSRARREYEALELDPPGAWRPEAVRERANDLEEELAGARLSLKRQELAEEAGRELEQLEAEEREHASDREGIRAAIGVDPGRSDLDLVVFARRAAEYREADQAHRVAASALERRREAREQQLEDLNNFLLENAAEPGNGAADIEAAIQDLKDRGRDRREAEAARERARARGEQLDRLIREQESRAADLLVQAGVPAGERRELENRLQRLEGYRELTKEKDRCLALVEARTNELSAAGDLLSLSLEEIEGRLEEARRRAARRDELSGKIRSIRDEVSGARRRDHLEKLQADLAAAEERLAERLDEKLGRAAGAFLLGGVRDEHDRVSRPELLGRAAELFERFTAHEFDLRLEVVENVPVFRAVEASTGDSKSLEQLSEGTRIQLLLAARLAFATRAERSRDLPFFLDEVLTTADPRRFDAVARSLLALIREENRQIFYLTSDPADAARWNALIPEGEAERTSSIDLAVLRRLQSAASTERELAPVPLPQPPPPSGRPAAEYGRLLEVPPVRPERPADGLHLFHLLDDDLELLHRLLVLGIDNPGRWKGLVRAGRADDLFGAERVARLSALCELAEACFEAWRVGRGKKIDAGVLRAAKVPATFLERFEALVEELGGDADELLRVIEARDDERVKRFRSASEEELRNYLAAEGYTDARDPLDEPAIVARVLTALAAQVQAGRLTPEEVARRVRRLLAASGE